ncbi:hypothetical protein AN476_10005 [Phaeobacter sp. 11ANDIMAR09]|nr:hypothetical protein AN476_10005 [Phaeobacter sp. 11ANDIMAR09]
MPETESIMTEYQPVILTAAEIQNIEARAHEMRAQAMADALRSLGRGLSFLFRKLSSLLLHPRAA